MSTDWTQWSKQAVAQLKERNTELMKRHELAQGAAYGWDLDSATIAFDLPDQPTFSIECIGTHSKTEKSFSWSWQDEALPPACKQRVEQVRSFGEHYDLDLLRIGQRKAGPAEALEMLAASGRILDAQGFWIEPMDDLTVYLLIFEQLD